MHKGRGPINYSIWVVVIGKGFLTYEDSGKDISYIN